MTFLTWIYHGIKVLQKLLIWLLVGSSIAGFLLFSFVQTAGFKRWLVDTANEQLLQPRGLEARIDILTGLFPFNVSVINGSLHKLGDPDTLLSVENIDIELDVSALVYQKWGIQRLHIDSLKIYKSLYLLDSQQPINTDRILAYFSSHPLFIDQFYVNDAYIETQMTDPLHGDADPKNVIIENMDILALIEISDLQRYINLQDMEARLNHAHASRVKFSTQLFSDFRFLELNSLNLNTGELELKLSADAENVDITQNLINQLEQKVINFELDTLSASPTLLSKISGKSVIDTLLASGSGFFESNEIRSSDFALYFGESKIQLDPLQRSFFNFEYREAVIHLAGSRIQRQSIQPYLSAHLDAYAADLTSASLEGSIEVSGASKFAFNGNLGLGRRGKLKSKLSLHRGKESLLIAESSFQRLNLRELDRSLPQSNLNGRFETKINFTDELSSLKIDARIQNSSLDRFSFGRILTDVEYENGFLTVDASSITGNESIGAHMVADFTGDSPILNSQGTFQNVDLRRYFETGTVAATRLNGDWRINGSGNSISNLAGALTIDFDSSKVGDSWQPIQQVYFDINDANQPKREIRLTTSVADIIVSGEFDPGALPSHFTFWSENIQDKVSKELSFFPRKQKSVPLPEETVEIAYEVSIKNIPLLQKYLNSESATFSLAQAVGTLRSDSLQLLLTADVFDDSLRLNQFSYREASLQFSANIWSEESLKAHSGMDLRADFPYAEFGKLTLDEVNLSISQNNAKSSLSIEANQINNKGFFEMLADVDLRSDRVSSTFRQISAGADNYVWNLGAPADVFYHRNGQFEVDSLTMRNADQRLLIDGVFSNSSKDSVNYRLINVELAQLQEILQTEFSFSGKVDAGFFTKSLTQNPTVEGAVYVTDIKVDNRILGNLTATSFYDAEDGVFDSRISLQTDTVRYADYVERSGAFQDLVVYGYFRPPNLVSSPEDTLFYFDIEFRELDGWIVDYMIADIFRIMEGKGTGSGYLLGTREDVDFRAELELLESELVTTFMNARYSASGTIILDRQEGAVLDSLTILDFQGGSGTLFGSILWNDFKREKPLNISLEATNLEIMDNSFASDVPFYGTAYATGRVNLSGWNIKPVMRTPFPVVITPGSQLAIPILDQETVEERNNFIEFVNSFDTETLQRRVSQTQIRDNLIPNSEKTFSELFTLDLQFDIPTYSKVQLVFDPVIDEILNAEGSGQFRLTLDNQEYQLFGRFDINSGDYLFTGGDLLTRLFNLRPGGTMVWDGDLINGIVDIDAEFRARPDLTPVMPTLNVNTTNQNNRLYTPINLVLEIDGPLLSLQNDFYFELANNISVTNDANMIAAIDQLNNPETKLIQATSLLLTGGFIEVAQTNQQRLGDNFNNRVTQSYFARLLSTQINSVLNSNLENLDVDINMNGFDQFSQAELGLALRLFDDRLILRREGQITGQQASIGDIGATYRINQFLSVEAFHRQDPSRTSFQSQDIANQQAINGVGLEAAVQFHTWKEFRTRIGRSIRKLFGRKEEDPPSVEDLASTRNPQK